MDIMAELQKQGTLNLAEKINSSGTLLINPEQKKKLLQSEDVTFKLPTEKNSGQVLREHLSPLSPPMVEPEEYFQSVFSNQANIEYEKPMTNLDIKFNNTPIQKYHVNQTPPQSDGHLPKNDSLRQPTDSDSEVFSYIRPLDSNSSTYNVERLRQMIEQQ